MADNTKDFLDALGALRKWCEEQTDQEVIGGEFFTSVWTVVELGSMLFSEYSLLYTQARELADAIQAVKTSQQNAAAILMSNMPQDVMKYIIK